MKHSAVLSKLLSMKKIETREELQIKVNQLEAKISEIEDTESKSSACLENSPVCTKIVDLDFNLQYMSNAGICALQIDDVSSLYGKPYPFSFFPSAYNKAMNENLFLAKQTGETIIQEGEVLDVKGNPLWFEASITPVYNKLGEMVHLLVISIDTWARKQAEESLRTTNERHSAMIENISDVIAVMEVDGRIKYQSLNIEKWFGWTQKDMINTNGWDYLHPEDIKQHQKEFSKLLEKENASTTIEFRYKCKDGNYKWVELNAVNRINDPNIKGILLNYHDISERKQAEEKLQESERRFRNAITYAPYPIMIHSEGNVLQLSEEWTNKTGYTIDDIPSIKQWTLKAYGKDAVPSQEFIDNLYKIDKPQNDGEWEVKKKNGTSLLWDFSSSPIGKLPNGKKW